MCSASPPSIRLQIDLLFERFVCEERKEPPDIDVDFEHERREEVIQYIYQRYGHHRAALAATVIRYRPRSAIREVGKCFRPDRRHHGGDRQRCVGKLGQPAERTAKSGRAARSRSIRSSRARSKVANELIGFPRHLSQHVGGFVLTNDRLDEIVPIGPATMEDRHFIEWDKDDIDALRNDEGRCAGARHAHLHPQGIRSHRASTKDSAYDLATVPREDPAVYDMLCEADAIGVFQVESRAQMSMLPRLQAAKNSTIS